MKRVIEKLNCEIIVSLDSIVKPTYESPLLTRCASLLAGDAISARVRNVLVNSMYTDRHLEAGDLVQLSETDPVEDIKTYFKALWDLGELRESEVCFPTPTLIATRNAFSWSI